MMNMTKSFTFFTLLLFQTVAFALTPEEVACNQSLNKNDAKTAITQADALLKLNPENEHAWSCKGRALYLQDNTEAALAAFLKAEEYGTDNYEKAFASLLAGHVYKHTKMYDKAIDRYEKSLEYASKAKHQALIFNNHLNIGNIYFEDKMYEKALEKFQTAHELAGNDNERGDTLIQLSRTYYALERYDEAVEYQIKTQIMLEKVGSLDQYADASINLGKYYFANGREIDAERTLNKIIDFAKTRGGAYYEAKASYILAQVKAAQQQEAAARALITHAKAIAKKSDDKTLLAEINKQTAGLFK